jgi:glycerol-3-phosphate responsive antiterminator
MTIASVELQKGLYTHLASGPYEVYESVPPDTAMPYITIGNITKMNSHTKTSKRYTFSCTIHSWSRGSSSLEQKTIDEFIHTELMEGFTTTGYAVDFVELVMGENLRESTSDSSVFHGVQEFEITLAE